MFGRLRPPPSPPDYLERSPAKIIKDDPLSVYESTLLKLKEGSRLDLSPSSETSSATECENGSDASASVDMRETHVIPCDGEDPMTIDLGSGECKSGGSSKQQKNRNRSVLYMFSRYKSLVHTQSSSRDEDMRTKDALCSNVS